MTILFIYLAIAIGVSFLCSVLEAVLLSITPSYVEQLTTEKPRSGQLIIRAKERLDESLSSILILNTFAHTMGAAGVGSQALQVFGPEWETLIAIILTLAILYFSEIIPKTLGATFWRNLAIPAVFIISWLVKLVYPLVWISTRLTRLFTNTSENEISREEIIALASIGHREGALFTHENEYLTNLLNLREVRTEQILTPRTVVHMLDESLTVKEALDNESTSQFTRIPIYAGSTDNVTGKVIRVDLFTAERNGQGDIPIKDVAKKVIHVSEKLPAHNLLDTFIKNQMHLFIVDDKYGQTSGIVTLEDVIETLLGREIVDENDAVVDMQQLAKEKYRERLRTTEQQQSDDQATQ
jgi:CBS domain containing-hemolysin-like protein